MRRSEIFDSFVKIAQEKGLISEGVHAEHTEKNLDNPRWDSLSIEQIGKLYNTKPDLPEDMQYKKNIIEDAHPEPVVLSPAHDKLNGLVENEQEGQNIRLRIVMKQPDGHLTNRKYARKQLLLSLVSLANEMDNRDEHELRKLADVCLAQASSKKIEKKAFWGIVAALAVAALGAFYLQQHMPFHSDGWTADYDRVLNSIDSLLTSNDNWGVGYTYTPDFIQTINQLKTELGELNAEMVKILPIIDSFEKPREEQALKAFIQQPEVQSDLKAIDEFKQSFARISPFIRTVLIDLQNPMYKQRAIQEKGMITSLIDSTSILHGGRGLVADDFDTLAGTLQTLMQDITKLENVLDKEQIFKKQVASQIISSKAPEATSVAPVTAPETVAPSAPTAQPETGIAGLEGEGEGLLGGLLGG